MGTLRYPEEFAEEREAIIAEIYAAWKDVTREGGISWSEVWCVGDPLDDTPEDRAAAREQDNELGWEELVEAPPWTDRHHPVLFFDPVASSYYVAPMLVCTLRGKSAVHLKELLLLTTEGFDYRHDRWSLLDDRQQQCIARFLDFMHRTECFEHGVHFRLSQWLEISKSYWHRFHKEV